MNFRMVEMMNNKINLLIFNKNKTSILKMKFIDRVSLQDSAYKIMKLVINHLLSTNKQTSKV
jgi:hypothetical protein